METPSYGYPLILAALVATACYPWNQIQLAYLSQLTGDQAQASEFLCPQVVQEQTENDAFPPISSRSYDLRAVVVLP
jgi:hypothetical protein